AVAVFQRDDIGDAKAAVLQKHDAIDRRRVGRGRIDPAVFDLPTRQLDAGGFLHVAAGDVGAAVAERPHHIRWVVGTPERTAADADREIERLAAVERIRADPQQGVVADIGADGKIVGGRGDCREDAPEERGRGGDGSDDRAWFHAWNHRL